MSDKDRASIPIVDCVFFWWYWLWKKQRNSQDLPVSDMTVSNFVLEDKELFSQLKTVEERKEADNSQTH